jgi:hypothetical protein
MNQLERPPVLKGFEWQPHSAGWNLRRVYYVGKQRHRRHIGHLGRQVWRDMQTRYAPEQIADALRQRFAERIAQKQVTA